MFTSGLVGMFLLLKLWYRSERCLGTSGIDVIVTDNDFLGDGPRLRERLVFFESLGEIHRG